MFLWAFWFSGPPNFTVNSKSALLKYFIHPKIVMSTPHFPLPYRYRSYKTWICQSCLTGPLGRFKEWVNLYICCCLLTDCPHVLYSHLSIIKISCHCSFEICSNKLVTLYIGVVCTSFFILRVMLANYN